MATVDLFPIGRTWIISAHASNMLGVTACCRCPVVESRSYIWLGIEHAPTISSCGVLGETETLSAWAWLTSSGSKARSWGPPAVRSLRAGSASKPSPCASTLPRWLLGKSVQQLGVLVLVETRRPIGAARVTRPGDALVGSAKLTAG